MEGLLGLPTDYSYHGAAINSLLSWVHWLMLVLFVGWGGFYLLCLFKFRQKKNPKADYHGVKNHVSTYLEIGVAAIEALLLIGFSIPIWAKAVDNFPDEKGSVVVRVVAEQFAWNFHYPGPDGKFGRTHPKFVDTVENPLGLDRSDPNGKDDIHTINQLIVPINKPVIAKITSKDVIHSFGVPGLRLKQDAIPGMEIPLWFMATKPGQVEIACSQLCGNSHYRMRGFIQMKTQPEFDAWLARQAKKAQEEASGDDFWD